MFNLTAKQDQFLYSEGARLNFLSGSVRSGKTYVSVLKWCLWLLEQPLENEYIMVGKTVSSLKRNCFGYITTLIGEANFTYSTSKKEAYIFGRKVYLEGANDERAEQKIRGMTLAGAYCDEVTLYPESFFSMLLSRLSVEGAKLWATCNPDNPQHYIKIRYIDRASELDCVSWDFILTDNTFLPKAYIDAVSKEYTGVFYERFILGRWVKAEGLVYPFYGEACEYDEQIEPGRQSCEYYVSMDYGAMNPTAMHLWCVDYKAHIAYIVREYYYDGRHDDGGQKTDSEYYEDLCRLTDGYIIEDVIIDPSAASFIAEIRKHGYYSVRKANNDVIEGIRKTGTYLKDGKVKVHKDCVHTKREFGLYAWDDKSEKDRVIKENDHAMDSIRYFCYTVLRRADW